MKVRLLVLLSLLVAPIWGQVFPGGVATDADLLVARDKASSTLDGDIDGSVNTFNVTTSSTFTDNMVVVIDDEQIFCTTFSGTTFSGCTRGYGGTTPATHDSGAGVYGYIVAAHHNGLKDELKAIENSLVGSSYIGTMLRFGGTSSSYPALKRNGTAIDVRLADDTGYAGLEQDHTVYHSTVPRITYYDTNADTDEKYWDLVADQGTFKLKLLDDSYANPVTAFSIDRSGTTPEIGIFYGDRFELQCVRPTIDMYQTDAGIDEKRWRIFVNGTRFSVQTVDDGYSAATEALIIDRSGNSATNFRIRTGQNGLDAIAINSNGFKIYDTGTKPACSSATRGYIWRDEGGAGVADKLEVCAKNSSDTYAWYPLASIP